MPTSPDAQQPPAGKLRVRVGLAFVQALRPLLYALLASSALLAFFAGDGGSSRRMPRWMVNVAPALFLVFLVVFAVYRLKLVAAKRYPALLGFFQIGLGALVLMLLLPGQRQQMSDPTPADDVGELLSSQDSRVRAVAAEAAAARHEPLRYAGPLLELLSDPEPRVRTAARRSLAHLAGSDPAAGKDDEAAVQIWRDEAKRRGWIALK